MVRSLLSRADNLADFLRFAAPEVAARFRFERAEPMPREAIAEDLRKREADVPFLIPFQADEGEVDVSVHVVLEHQAAPDVAVPLRQLLVASNHWNQQWVEWSRTPPPREPFRLDPVYAVIL
ncbi:MAG: Rpn family recombination-promoting nuclease/putative transposase [Gemmataceae bacterium]|nr:Rpn family recombination-promoting nuclease/putative transposase [Gemmataceae bacterium]